MAGGAAAAATGASAQASSVISAKVQQILAENLVQVAIGNLLLELASDMPLQVGQTVQLAVSQTDQGVRLTIVGTGAGAADPASATVVNVAAPLNPIIPPASDRLTGLERLAVTIATEEAVTQQGGQGQLFADLNAVADAPGLPPALRAAITQVLAQQTPLDTNLTGEDVQKAFQNSGLLLEASLATVTTAAPNGTTPDLKAALIVLRQALASVVQTVDTTTEQASVAPTGGPTTYTAPTATAAMPQRLLASDVPTSESADEQPMTSAPSLAPEIDAEVMPRQPMPATQALAGRLQLVDGPAVNVNTPVANAVPGMLMQAKPQSLTPSAVLALLQEAQQQIPRAAGFTAPRAGFQDATHGDV
ncbi:MAG: flagellar hook-length control protein FliK, partial [Tardiphaga sp.]